jgi:predicted SAM-dependent methyltransferase
MKKLMRILLNVIPREWLIRFSYLAQQILPILLKGNKYTDPIDHKEYIAFLPYGYGKLRSNVLSPGTLSLERHRLLWLYLKTTDFFSAKLKVLHVAPEQCFYSIFRKMKNLDYTTTDLYSPLADVKADICDLPFEDHTFDVVFCNHVLEHIIEDQTAMKELYRIMKPNGWGIFQVPIENSRSKTYENFSITTKAERKKHFGQYDHVRIYGKDYYDRLKSVGFYVEQINLSDSLTNEQITKFALQKNEILPVVRKNEFYTTI